MTLAVHHDPGTGRFTADIDGHRAVLDYRLDDTTMSILHTAVPGAIGGRGVAAQLTRAALEHARSAGWKVRPLCSYAAEYVRRHADFAALVGP